jgi:hypothetical protein
VQGDWIIDAMVKLRDEGITYCDPTHEAELEWRKKIDELSDKTLIPQTKSWYMGDNVPGKVREQLSFAGGLRWTTGLKGSLRREIFITGNARLACSIAH